MCGIIGYVGRSGGEAAAPQRAAPARVPRLRLRRHRAPRGGRPRLRPRGREPPEPRSTRPARTARLRSHGLGHTRWATHGGVTEQNAHPLVGCDASKIAIVLNGIVENYRELREQLVAEGHSFTSETDAEVVVHMLEQEYDGDLVQALDPRVPAARRSLHDRRDPSRQPRRARRRSPSDAARRRPRRRRELPRLERRRVPRRDAARRLPRRRRSRRDHAERRALLQERRRGRASRGRGARLGRGPRREGRLRDLHAEGDLRAAGGRARDDRRPRPRPRT